jgi:hypothetical protein
MGIEPAFVRTRDEGQRPTSVGDDDALAFARAAKKLAQATLQLSNAHSRHAILRWPHDEAL